MAREYVIPTKTVMEAISAIEEYITANLVRVSIGVVDAEGAFVVPQTFSQYEINGADFTELMSAGPAWALNKPAGTYRNDDLWIFIDRQRAA